MGGGGVGWRVGGSKFGAIIFMNVPYLFFAYILKLLEFIILVLKIECDF